LSLASLAALGFVAWGLWVNWDYGPAARVRVALTQAGISFAATFGSAEVLRWVARWFGGWRWRWPATSVAGWFVINLAVFAVHHLCGTPEVLRTMIPGMLTGVGFCAVYGGRLTRAS